MCSNNPKPFLKWVGGKRQLLPEIHKRFPVKFNKYFELFVGGGAVLFSLENGKIEKHINDYNEELINTYLTIKNDVNSLIRSLSRHKNTPEHYYMTREKDRKSNYNKLTNVQRASRFIYLNKTGYNGLYRVNAKGEANTPFGRYANPKILDKENLLKCSEFLQNVSISCGDFYDCLDMIKENDFVYLDPPYDPVSKTANFSSYTKNGFNDDMQKKLKNFCDEVNNKNAYFLLSNSCTPFIVDLYSSYKIDEVRASRAINCKGNGRGKVSEVLVRNY